MIWFLQLVLLQNMQPWKAVELYISVSSYNFMENLPGVHCTTFDSFFSQLCGATL